MAADGNTCFRFFVPERNIRAQAQKRRNVKGGGGGGQRVCPIITQRTLYRYCPSFGGEGAGPRPPSVPTPMKRRFGRAKMTL